MKIVDTHAHIGTSRNTGVTITEDALINAMRKNSVSAALVMPQPVGYEESCLVHKKIYELSKKFPKMIYGISCVDPWVEEDSFMGETIRCIEEYGFKALKINCHGHNISPLSVLCEKIYKTAFKYRLPIVVHTGLGTPVSLPSLVMKPATDYPEVIFILAHAGFALYCDEAIVAASLCKNIILEPSWCQTFMVSRMIKTIGIDRVIMGSDHLTNLPMEILKYHCIDLTDEDRKAVFDTNPGRIFQLDA
ncbi:MAG: amidohydrolase family protein [Spirochaetales bacterium]|nr:amidohydrolase family protein [Spirochaetales bacterium]